MKYVRITSCTSNHYIEKKQSELDVERFSIVLRAHRVLSSRILMLFRK